MPDTPAEPPIELPHPLSVVLPPYGEADASRWDGGPVPRGAVFLLELTEADVLCTDQLRIAVHALRRRYDASVAIRLPVACADSVNLVTRCHSLGIRAVLLPGRPMRETIWRFLSNPMDLPGDWLAWVRHRTPVSLHSAHIISRITLHAAEAESVTALSDRIGLNARTIRYHLGNDGLPKPERWFDAARLISSQLDMQRDAGLTTSLAARRLGYEDAHSFANRVRSVFGHSLTVARDRLGLEWRFAGWWALAFSPQRPCAEGPHPRGRRARVVAAAA